MKIPFYLPQTLQRIRKRGIWRTLSDVLWMDHVMGGQLVGRDKYGNEYYQQDNDEAMHGTRGYLFVGHNRFVKYANLPFNHDASQVAPEWHGWLHYTTDEIPAGVDEAIGKPNHEFVQENFTHTNAKYAAYSTTKPKIAAWKPKSSNEE